MTQPQIATIGKSTIEVLPGGEGFAPFARITHCSAWGCTPYVSQKLSSVNFEQLIAAGFDIIDPQHFVTCACGALIDYGMYECRDCAAEERDWANERNRYIERYSYWTWSDDPRNIKCNGVF